MIPDENEIPTIASWWVGWRMSWIEQLCLRSFVDQGHKVILYTHGEVDNVPEGVEQRPDTQIWDPGKLITYQGEARREVKGSPAPHADLFRYQLLNKTDYIWIDTDAYCHQRFPNKPWIFAGSSRSLKEEYVINNGVLRLPRHSQTLKLLIKTFASGDEYPILPWKPKRSQLWQRLRKMMGFGIHISRLRWMAVGPIALTKFLEITGEIEHALPAHIFYPLPFPKDGRYNIIFGTQEDLAKHIPHDCLSIHLYTSTLFAQASRRDLVRNPPKEGWLYARARELGIDPAQAPQRIKEKPA